MGLLNNKIEKEKNKVKKKVKGKIIVAAIPIALKLIPLILIISIIASFIEFVIKTNLPINTVDEIYEQLDIDDVSELIQIKGSSENGYYLDFVDDIDDKLDKTIEYLNSTAGVKSNVKKEFLKKMIQAEVCAEFPNLGGTTEGDGFQGITDILRITPNKEINSMDNTGAGQETVKVEQDDTTEITNKDEIDAEEAIIKNWSNNKELTLLASAYVYKQEDSKIHQGEKIDYWTPIKDKSSQINITIEKDEKVTYTGKYSKSVDKMTNEGLIYVGIKKDDIEGYIKYKFVEENSEGKEVKNDDDATSRYDNLEQEKVTDTIDSKVFKLSYIPKEDFDKYVTDSDKNALNYFTIDDEGQLITATWSTDDSGSVKIQNNSTINLKTALQNYIVPYAYLMYFYIEADYTDFSSDLADEILDSTIILALEDNVSTSESSVTVENKKVSQSDSLSYDWTSVSSEIQKTESCNTNIDIIFADTWCAKLVDKDIYKDDLLNVEFGQTKNINMPGTVSDSTSDSISEESEAEKGTDTSGDNQYSYTVFKRTVTKNHQISNSYKKGNKEVTGNESIFVNLFKEHDMYKRINDKRLLIVLEKDSRTANLVNLTKYLMYMATDVDYGVKEFDFSTYKNEEFTDTNSGGGSSASDLLVKYVHTWENASPPTNSDGTKYIIEDDGAGHPTVGYGVDINNSGYLELFKKGGYPTNIGGEVDKDFVDSIEKKIMESNIKTVKAKTAGLNLTGYQINALVSRMYNCGPNGTLNSRNGKTFVEAYKAYWNQNTDDYYVKKNKSADFNHKLYTNYLNQPTTTNHGKTYLRGLERRRKSEWTLFQTGYYDNINEWHTEGGSIVEIAKTIHEYMEKNNYTYCVYEHNSYEECKDGNHGLETTFEKSKTGKKHTCCATYVSWVLQEAGYIKDSEHINSANELQTLLKNKGFKKINNASDLQPGDVLCYDHHVEIYAGDNKVYNAGSGKAIRSASPHKRGRSFSYALRAPK